MIFVCICQFLYVFDIKIGEKIIEINGGKIIFDIWSISLLKHVFDKKIGGNIILDIWSKRQLLFS